MKGYPRSFNCKYEFTVLVHQISKWPTKEDKIISSILQVKNGGTGRKITCTLSSRLAAMSENKTKDLFGIPSTNNPYCLIYFFFLTGLLQIELKTRKTCFWRHQKGKPDTYLSTIEAIYYFLVDYHQEILKENYKGQYDNLLYFFSFMYTLIKNAKCCAGRE